MLSHIIYITAQLNMIKGVSYKVTTRKHLLSICQKRVNPFHQQCSGICLTVNSALYHLFWNGKFMSLKELILGRLIINQNKS